MGCDFAILVLRAGEVVTVDQIVDCLWPGAPPTDPRAALQVHVVRLRRLLGPALAIVTPGYTLTVGPDELDVAEFERLVAVARGLAADGLLADAASTMRAARDGQGLDGPVRRLHRLREQAEDDHADLLLALGGREDLVAELEDRVEEDPGRTRAWGQLARALVAAGRPAAARARLEAARAQGYDVPPAEAASLQSADEGSVPLPGLVGDPTSQLRARLRALLCAARPHPLPIAVLRAAVDERPEVLDRALEEDPATITSRRGETWRLREDVHGTVTDATVEDLTDAAVAVAHTARAELVGPDIAAAAALAAAVSPVLERALRDDVRALEVTSAMGRWWSLQSRHDLVGVMASALLAEPPRDPTAAARWCTTRGHAAEFFNDRPATLQWFLDAADRWEALGHGHHAAVALCNAAINAHACGDQLLAVRLLARARARPAAVVGPLPRHAVTMAEAAVLRHDFDDARHVLARCSATIDGRNRVMEAFVRAELELADGQVERAVRVLEAVWGQEGKLLRGGAGTELAATYARLAVALDRPVLELIGCVRDELVAAVGDS